MIYVIYDQVEVMILVDKVVVFNGGCVEQVGLLLEFYYYLVNLFVVGFFGMLKMGFLCGYFSCNQGECCEVVFECGVCVGLLLCVGELVIGSLVIFGICLEYLNIVCLGYVFQGLLWVVVDVSECLGSDSFCYVCVDLGEMFILCVCGDFVLDYGVFLELGFDLEYCYLFDSNGQVFDK